MNLNEKLTELRKAKGLTQQEIAEALNVSRQAVSRWEVGTAAPSLDNLVFLSRLYGVPLDGLIQEEAGEPADAPGEASTDASTDAPAEVRTAVPARTGRSYATPVCAFLAVLILGVGILIGLNLQKEPGRAISMFMIQPADQPEKQLTIFDGPPEPDNQSLPDEIIEKNDTSSDVTNHPVTYTPAPESGDISSDSPEDGPGADVDIEKMLLQGEGGLAERIAAQQEEAKKNAPPRAKLSDEDAQELAEQYNPIAMTREEYDSILETLVDKGVLTRDEIGYMGYKGITAIDLTTIHEAMVIPLNDPIDQASRDLLWSNYSMGSPYGGTRFNNADGTYDVLAWADMMNTYRNIDTESWQGYHGALYDALSQVKSAREEAK